MGDNNSKETIFCSECNAKIPKDNKFCSKCGKPVKKEPVNAYDTKCPQCKAELKPGLKFCTECGSKIESIITTDSEHNICHKCNAEVEPGLKFCTNCGTEIKLISNIKTCPKCYSDVTPGLIYCTECGTSLEARESVSSANINEKLRQKRESGEFQVTPGDENVDELVNTGKNVMKGIGGLLNQAKGDLDHMLKSSDAIYNQSNQEKNNQIRPKIKPKTNGYLVCDKCKGFYELDADESPDNFELECECGGKLEFKERLSEK